MLFALLSSFFTNCILVVNGKEKAMLLSTVVSAAVNMILNLFILPKYGMTGAAVTTLIAEAVNLGIQGYASRGLVAKKLLAWADIAKALTGAALVAAVCILTTHYMGQTIKALIIAIPASVVVYFGFNLLVKNRTLLSFVKRSK